MRCGRSRLHLPSRTCDQAPSAKTDALHTDHANRKLGAAAVYDIHAHLAERRGGEAQGAHILNHSFALPGGKRVSSASWSFSLTESARISAGVAGWHVTTFLYMYVRRLSGAQLLWERLQVPGF